MSRSGRLVGAVVFVALAAVATIGLHRSYRKQAVRLAIKRLGDARDGVLNSLPDGAVRARALLAAEVENTCTRIESHVLPPESAAVAIETMARVAADGRSDLGEVVECLGVLGYHGSRGTSIDGPVEDARRLAAEAGLAHPGFLSLTIAATDAASFGIVEEGAFSALRGGFIAVVEDGVVDSVEVAGLEGLLRASLFMEDGPR